MRSNDNALMTLKSVLPAFGDCGAAHKNSTNKLKSREMRLAMQVLYVTNMRNWSSVRSVIVDGGLLTSGKLRQCTQLTSWHLRKRCMRR
jgi:hypothetical protein